MKRVPNFYPGPGALPLEAIEYAQQELVDFQGTGMSLLEMSHRSTAYQEVHDEAFALLRELMALPDNYHIMFLQGGASLQFAMLPMNLLAGGKVADYIDTGVWSTRAITEAKIVGKANVIASSKDDNYNHVPKNLPFTPGAAYVHLTSNNTIMGTQWFKYPDTGDVPLIGDMSSDILCRKVDPTQFGVIYAGAHKNLGPSGTTIVMMRDDVLAKCDPSLPPLLKYSTHVEHQSMFNTPVTFSIYMVRNVLRHLKETGGVEAMEKMNFAKGELFYNFLDNSGGYYTCPIAKEDRSIMNIVFNMPTTELENKFVAEAIKNDVIGLKNLPQRGHLRISLYNSVSLESVRKVLEFMKEFQRVNG